MYNQTKGKDASWRMVVDMKKYYLLEKGESGGNSYKKYNFKELKDYFKPDDEADDEELKSWDRITNIDELKEFIDDFVNNNGGMHYHDYYIEEV